jgi:hypothetical protein
MTVATLREQIGNDEYTQWAMYYARIAQRRELEQLKAGL